MHDGFNNPHSFTYEGKQITLMLFQTAFDPLIKTQDIANTPILPVPTQPVLLVNKFMIFEEF